MSISRAKGLKSLYIIQIYKSEPASSGKTLVWHSMKIFRNFQKWETNTQTCYH